VVRSSDGEVLDDPEPIDLSDVEPLAQLMAEEAGVDPGSLLESL